MMGMVDALRRVSSRRDAFAASAAMVVAAVLSACSSGPTPTTSGGAPGAGYATRGTLSPLSMPRVSEIISADRLTPVDWSAVQGWQGDSLLGATASLRQTCFRLRTLPDWRTACAAVQQLDELDENSTRAYFQQYFQPYQLANRNGSVDGLITGYYEPLLHGSRVRHAPYLYPLYRWPMGVRRGAPLPARPALERAGILDGNELVYVDDPIEAFFLQVQGSGRVVMDDGSVMRVGFGGTNNQPYESIGSWLLRQREISPAQATMQGIKAWARANPSRVPALLDVNPRFVFFKEMPPVVGDDADGPLGALGVPLTPERSIAVDPTSIPLGVPVFLSTTRPLSNAPLNRLVFAQDTGSAIRGGVRADYFWGHGDDAGDLAGRMKQSGRMWLLLPKQ